MTLRIMNLLLEKWECLVPKSLWWFREGIVGRARHTATTEGDIEGDMSRTGRGIVSKKRLVRSNRITSDVQQKLDTEMSYREPGMTEL